MTRSFLFLLILLTLVGLSSPVYAQQEDYQRYTFLFAGIPYSFQYPASWETNDSFGSVIAANTSTTKLSENLKGNEIVLWVTPVEYLYFAWEIHDTPDNLAGMAKVLGRYASDPRSNQWDFGEARSVQLSHHRPAMITTGAEAKKKSVASYIVVEYNQRYIVFWGFGADGSGKNLEALLIHTANSLRIGDEVDLEKTTILNSAQIPLRNTFAIATKDGFVYTVGSCNKCSTTFTKLSSDGQIVEKFEQENPAYIVDLTPNADGTFWAVREDNLIYDVERLSKEGKVLQRLNLAAKFPPRIRNAPSGNLYILLTREIVPQATQPPGEVPHRETEDWLQIRSSTGTLLQEFLIKKEEYTLGYGSEGMAFDVKGNVYVVFSQTNKGIVVYNPTGSLIAEGFARGKVMFQRITAFDILADGTMFLAFSNGEIAKPAFTILHLDAQGKLVGVFSGKSLGLQEGCLPKSFGTTSNNKVLIAALCPFEAVQLIQLSIHWEF